MANLARHSREQHPGATVTKRTRNSIHLDIGGGRHIAYIGGSNAYHLPDEQTEIDTAWVAENVDGFQWGMTLADYHARARSVFNAGDLVRYTHPDSGHWVIFDPQSINWINQDYSRQQIAIKQGITATAGTGIDDDLLTWSNAYGTGRHMTYRAAPGRLEKNIILDAPGVLPAATVTGTVHFEAEFALKHSTGLELWLDGVLWAKTNGVRVKTANRIEFKDVTGNVLFYMAAPFAADSAGNEAATEYEVRRQGASYFCTVRVPKTWLDAAVFPVYIDPTLTQVSETADAYLYGYNANYATARATATNANTTGSVAYIGQITGYTIYRTLCLFDTSSLDGYTVDQANLRLVCTYDASNTDFDIQIVKQDWSAQNPITIGNRDAAYDNCLTGTADDSIWRNTSGLSLNTQYTSGNLDTAWVSTAGTTYYSLRSNNDYNGTTPTQSEQIGVASANNATASYRPALIVEYSEAGGSQALDGTSSATSGASGALAVSRPLSASSSVTSGATASLSLALPLSASSAATTNATATLGLAPPLSGSSAATTNATGAIALAVALSGASAATTNATSEIGLSLPLTGTSAATSGASSSVGLAIPLSGSSAATTGATAALSLVVPLSGATAAASGASGEMVTAIALSGTSGATTNATGAAIMSVALSGSSAATSGATGAAVLSIALSASSAATSGAAGELGIQGLTALSGSASATSGASGSAITALALSAASVVATSATGAIGLTRPLSGSAVATTGATATLAATYPLSGTSIAVSGASGTAIVRVGLSGTSTSASGSNGTLVLAVGLSGTSNSTASGSGNIVLTLSLSGQADALTSATAVLVVVAISIIIYTGTVRGVGNIGLIRGPNNIGHVSGVGKTGIVYSSGNIEPI